MKSADVMRGDYEAIPWGWGRVYYNWLLISWIIVVWIGARIGKPHLWNGGRHTDGEPCVCHECGWIGRLRDAVHGYDDYECGESECPKCGKSL